MPTVRNHNATRTARAGALFVSAVQRSEQPSARQVRQAIAAALRQFGERGCAEQVAREFGEHPDLAGARMRWARQAAATAFGQPRRAPQAAPCDMGATPVPASPSRHPRAGARGR